MNWSAGTAMRQTIGLWVCMGYSALLTIAFVVNSVHQNHAIQLLDRKYHRQTEALQAKINSRPQVLNADSIETKSLTIDSYDGKWDSGGAYIDSNGLYIHSGNNSSTYVYPGLVDVKAGDLIGTLRPQNSR